MKTIKLMFILVSALFCFNVSAGVIGKGTEISYDRFVQPNSPESEYQFSALYDNGEPFMLSLTCQPTHGDLTVKYILDDGKGNVVTDANGFRLVMYSKANPDPDTDNYNVMMTLGDTESTGLGRLMGRLYEARANLPATGDYYLVFEFYKTMEDSLNHVVGQSPAFDTRELVAYINKYANNWKYHTECDSRMTGKVGSINMLSVGKN